MRDTGHLHCLKIISDNRSGQASLAGLSIGISEGDPAVLEVVAA